MWPRLPSRCCIVESGCDEFPDPVGNLKYATTFTAHIRAENL